MFAIPSCNQSSLVDRCSETMSVFKFVQKYSDHHKIKIKTKKIVLFNRNYSHFISDIGFAVLERSVCQ